MRGRRSRVTRCYAVEVIAMGSGGARNRSGPMADPESGRSERRGFKLDALPVKGFRGAIPKFPLSRPVVYWIHEDEDGKRVREVDEDATALRVARELELWKWAWRTPQAVAWKEEPWRWYSVAMWVRTAVVCESPEATAADKNSLHRFADQIGLTPAGLRENGWKISVDTVEQKAKKEERRKSGGSRDRVLRVAK